MKTILCINGSDSMGYSGIQADIRTARDMGAQCVTAVTSVTVQNLSGISQIHELPTTLVGGQIRAIYDDLHPHAVKVGLINNAETIRLVRDEIVGCRQVVCSLSILATKGGCLMGNEALHAYRQHLIPICSLLMLKCTDAEILLGRSINTDDDMTSAAHDLLRLGAQWVLLRGGTYVQGRINALLMSETYEQRFSSVNIEGWQRHGVGGTLSTAIATRLAMGDDVVTAVRNAHDYLHSQVVYAAGESPNSLRPNDLYNQFVSLVAENYRTAHDVAFYAERLAISTRYLAQITSRISGRSPKQIIDAHLVNEAEQILSNSTRSIQEIADQLGFTSQITFSKFFKAKKGVTPSAVRSMKR